MRRCVHTEEHVCALTDAELGWSGIGGTDAWQGQKLVQVCLSVSVSVSMRVCVCFCLSAVGLCRFPVAVR